eukprot:365606-Chlamydomonas_euryale.AAC.1
MQELSHTSESKFPFRDYQGYLLLCMLCAQVKVKSASMQILPEARRQLVSTVVPLLAKSYNMEPDRTTTVGDCPSMRGSASSTSNCKCSHIPASARNMLHLHRSLRSHLWRTSPSAQMSWCTVHPWRCETLPGMRHSHELSLAEWIKACVDIAVQHLSTLQVSLIVWIKASANRTCIFGRVGCMHQQCRFHDLDDSKPEYRMVEQAGGVPDCQLTATCQMARGLLVGGWC